MKKNSRKAKKPVEADLPALGDAEAHSLTVGIDVGDRFSEVCVLDREGSVLQRGRIRNQPARICEQFAGLQPQRVVLETGQHSFWLSIALSGCRHEVIVADARKLRMIYTNEKKSDEVDAFMLADLGRTNVRLLHPIQHRGLEAQRDLGMIRAREELVEARTKLINHTRGVVKSHGGRLPTCGSSSFGVRMQEEIPGELRGVLSGVLDCLDGMEEEIFSYERRLEHLAQTKYPEIALMRQVDGVGTLTALAFRLTIDDAGRFAKSRTVGAYFGLVRRRRQSGERDPELGITKAGDGLVRKLLVNCAHHILGPNGKDSDLRRWGLKLKAQGGRKATKRAATAVARKLAVLLHHLWVSGEVYEPLRVGAAKARTPATAAA